MTDIFAETYRERRVYSFAMCLHSYFTLFHCQSAKDDASVEDMT
jgi:hypothetical protein